MENTDKMVADALRKSWVHRFLPQSLWPYAQLARWERPIGWKLLMWPCWWSVMLALASSPDLIKGDDPLGVARYIAWLLFLFTIGSFIMRGAGCTYNDLVDQDIDDKVARTRSRPLPSGRVTGKQAAIFLGLQLLAGLIVLLQFNSQAFWVGIASLTTVAIYPFMKRITWWPQLFLGIAFSWGALMGWVAVEGELVLPPLFLYGGSIAWVIAYDTIYAYQDIEDDALVGVKSTARLFAENTIPALIALYSIAVMLFALAFWRAGVSWPAWVGLAGGALHLAWQIKTVDLDDPANCLMRFKSNSGFGWILFLGLCAAVAV